MAEHPKYKPTLGAFQRLNPSAPVLARVSKMMRDPKTEINAITELLRTDASLSSDIIRMSNSPYYGYSTTVSSLDEAIQRIGLKEAQKVVNLSLARSLYNKPLKLYQMSAYQFWAQGTACALLMERIAQQLDIAPNEAYTLGNLNSLGKLVLNQLAKAAAINDTWDGNSIITEWEESLFGLNYAQASYDLLTRWQFPESITEPIRNQFLQEEGACATAYALNTCINILFQTGAELKNPIRQIPESAQALELDSSFLEDAVNQSREQLLELREALK